MEKQEKMNEVYIRPMRDNDGNPFGQMNVKEQKDFSDRVQFEMMNEKYKKELSKFCRDGLELCIWTWDEFIRDPKRKGYMICIKENLSEETENDVPEYEVFGFRFRGEMYEDFGHESEKRVGFILCDYENYTQGNTCYITQFYVDDQFRRIGVGTGAMKCLGTREPAITMHVFKENAPAQSFWKNVMKSLGFTEKYSLDFLKVKTINEDCDYFYWQNDETMQILSEVARYNRNYEFPVGNKIYKSMRDLCKRKSKQDGLDVCYDKYGRVVVDWYDDKTDRTYYMLLYIEDTAKGNAFVKKDFFTGKENYDRKEYKMAQIFSDRKYIYIIRDTDVMCEMCKELYDKTQTVKEYLIARERMPQSRRGYSYDPFGFQYNGNRRSEYGDDDYLLEGWDDDLEPWKTDESYYKLRHFHNKKRRLKHPIKSRIRKIFDF